MCSSTFEARDQHHEIHDDEIVDSERPITPSASTSPLTKGMKLPPVLEKFNEIGRNVVLSERLESLGNNGSCSSEKEKKKGSCQDREDATV